MPERGPELLNWQRPEGEGRRETGRTPQGERMEKGGGKNEGMKGQREEERKGKEQRGAPSIGTVSTMP